MWLKVSLAGSGTPFALLFNITLNMVRGIVVISKIGRGNPE